jgi:drug/metabolite transporter (DMT)-like permease
VILVLLALGLAATGLVDMRAPLDATTVPLALYIGMVPIAVGNLLWHTGVSRLGVTLMSIYGNFVPVAAIALAVALGARPTVWHMAGGAIVLVGVIYAQVRAARANP